MSSLFITVVTCFLIINIKFINSAKILAIITIPSYSHQLVYQSILKNLSSRGHQITLVAPELLPDMNLENFIKIDISGFRTIEKNVNIVEMRAINSWQKIFARYLKVIANGITESTFNNTDFKKIYAPDSNEKFDLVIVEAVGTPGIYAFGHRFKAPLIGLCSLELSHMSHFMFGNPVIPSHSSSYELYRNVDLNLSFWKRIERYVETWWHIHVTCYYNMYQPQQEIAEKYLGDVPSIKELEKNISIVFVNQQEDISFTRPSVANVIKFNGLHIKKNITSKNLPKELQEFLDNATNGFIYVSFGTSTNSLFFPKKLKDIFLDVFSNLSMKVVWKFHENFKNTYDNIYTDKWFPQQEILAHPNLKLFVYQGGLQSTEEAIHFGVPLVGMPIIADQDMIIVKLQSLGVCKAVDILQMTRHILNETIMDVLNNESYKENMLKLKNLIEDKPYNSMDNVIWWIEYVIRHKGAPHLRSSIVDEPWYQRYDTDVIAFLSVALLIILFITFYIIYKLLLITIKYYVKARKIKNGKKQKIK